ncbi:MAG TPA: response regulator [Chthoniobacteraceae bacterium]|nr:response regulator [Chthoniobacteraceae bacterium]
MSLEPRHFLLVDDDDILRERLARALRTRGHRADAVADGPQALAFVQKERPDIVVLDLKMPGPSGLETLRQLRALAPEARFLMLTGYGSIASALEAMRLGAFDYLTKPADADQILAALNPPDPEAETEPEMVVPSLERIEWEHIQRVLAECNDNISKAAQVLGLHRRSLQRKLQKYPPLR